VAKLRHILKLRLNSRSHRTTLILARRNKKLFAFVFFATFADLYEL